jgi:2'-5' RNA ligase
MADQSGLRGLADAYRGSLGRFPGLDLVPPEWLHITVQGIGFVDELTDDEVNEVAKQVGERVTQIQAPVVEFDRPVVVPEAVFFVARPSEPLRELWRATGEGVTTALGPGRQYELLEQADGFLPHVTIAYSNRPGPAAPVVRAIEAVQAPSVTTRISRLQVMEFHRDERMYCWRELRSLPIGASV